MEFWYNETQSSLPAAFPYSGHILIHSKTNKIINIDVHFKEKRFIAWKHFIHTKVLVLYCIHYCLKDCKLFWCESLNTQYKEPKILPRSPVNSSHSEVIWTTPTEVLGVIPVFVVLGVLYHSTTVTPTKGPRDGKEGPTDQLLPTISYHRHTNSPRAWFAILTSFNIYHRLLFLR